MKCTWLDCQNEASVPQVGVDWVQWANLCAEHDAALGKAIRDNDPKAIVGMWVRAQGGAKAAAARMTRSC